MLSSASFAILTLAAASLAAPHVRPVQDDGRPAQAVTTDTGEYCARLEHQVDDLLRDWPSPPDDVPELRLEGRRLCKQGEARGGILRLRRAIVLLMGRDTGSP